MKLTKRAISRRWQRQTPWRQSRASRLGAEGHLTYHDHLACSFPEAYERLFPGLGTSLGSVRLRAANDDERASLGLQAHKSMCTDPVSRWGRRRYRFWGTGARCAGGRWCKGFGGECRADGAWVGYHLRRKRLFSKKCDAWSGLESRMISGRVQ